jgi:hypothetical protein
VTGVAMRTACVVLLCGFAALCGAPALAATLAGLTIQPDAPVAGHPFLLRLDGPFAQPTPVLSVRVVGDDVIASAYYEDFADPTLPRIPFVEVEATAPVAGAYRLVHQSCAGNVPPGVPPCQVIATGALQVMPAPQIPVASPLALLGLGLVLAVFARGALQASGHLVDS